MKKLFFLFCLCAGVALAQNVSTGPVVKKTSGADKGDIVEDFAVGAGRTVTIKAGATMEFEPGSTVNGLPSGAADGLVLFGNGVPGGGTGKDGDTYLRLDTPFGVYAKAAGSWTLQTTLVPSTRTVNGQALSGNVTLAKGDIGLGNVDNTSDADKPVSNATQTALDNKTNTGHTHLAANISDASATGRAVLTVANPGAIRFIRINADNTVTLLDDAGFRAAISAGTSDFDGAFGSLSGIENVLLSTGSYANPTWLTSLDKAKAGLGNVDNVAASALRDRTTHTGEQPQSSVTGLVTDLAAKETPAGAQAKADAISGKKDVWMIAVSDETTALTTGTAKATFRAPRAATVTAVRAGLTTVSSSGTPTFDINETGSGSIFSTLLTIDASEKTSTTAATAAVISDTSIADDAEITIDIDTAGTGATGAKVYIYVTY